MPFFCIIFQVLKVHILLIKICKIEPPDLLFMVVFISFYTVRQGKPSLRLHIIYLKDCLRYFSPHKLICMMSPNKCKV